MSLNAATIEVLLAKGLTGDDLLEVARAMECKPDPTNAQRQARHRVKKKAASNGVTVTPVTPPDCSPKDTQTPSFPPVEVSEAEASSPQPRPWALPIGVSLQIWTDFLGNRKRKRLGNTPTAWKAFQDDLARVASQTGIPPPELIEHAAAKGWGSINDPQTSQNGPANVRDLQRARTNPLSEIYRTILEEERQPDSENGDGTRLALPATGHC